MKLVIRSTRIKKISIVLLVIFFLVILIVFTINKKLYDNSQLLFKNDLQSPTKNELINIKTSPTPKLEKSEMRPFFNGEILITPPIFDFVTNKIKRFEFKTVPGWEFEYSHFSYSSYSKENVSYAVIMHKIADVNYKIQFDFAETEFNRCNFGENIPEISVFEVLIPRYTTVETSFGSLRLGEALMGESLHKKYFAICQKESEITGGSDQEWVGFTNVGFIRFFGSSNPDQNILTEVVEILKNIEVREYKKVN